MPVVIHIANLTLVMLAVVHVADLTLAILIVIQVFAHIILAIEDRYGHDRLHITVDLDVIVHVLVTESMEVPSIVLNLYLRNYQLLFLKQNLSFSLRLIPDRILPTPHLIAISLQYFKIIKVLKIRG